MHVVVLVHRNLLVLVMMLNHDPGSFPLLVIFSIFSNLDIGPYILHLVPPVHVLARYKKELKTKLL
jgi:hypothetical protein